MEKYYNENFGSPGHLPIIPKTAEEFYSLAMNMVNFTIHDEKIILTRKLLLTEQFHDDRVKSLTTEHFIINAKEIFKGIFEKMTEAGLLMAEDSDILALAFTAPITTLIHYCDREPEKESEIMRQIEAFVKHFIRIYGGEKIQL